MPLKEAMMNMRINFLTLEETEAPPNPNEDQFKLHIVNLIG